MKHEEEKPMTEILDDILILKEPVLDLKSLSLDCIPYGLDADKIPLDRIKDVTFSPIVFSSRSGTTSESEYFDKENNRLSLHEVIKSVINSSGILHVHNDLSYKITDGAVTGFAIKKQHLQSFGYLKSHIDCMTEFGSPDSLEENKCFGDTLGYDLYYKQSQKLIMWGYTSWDKMSSISVGFHT